MQKANQNTNERYSFKSMRMLGFLCLFFFLTVSPYHLVLYAKQGHFFLRHYESNLRNVDNQNYAIAQDAYGVVCFANRKGILKFDGLKWDLIHTPSSALALKLNTQDKNLYVGCRNDFGYISRDNKGHSYYQSLSAGLNFDGDISHIEIVGNWVYFLSEDYLYEYSSVERRITNSYEAKSEGHFFSMFQHQHEALLFTEDNSLLQVASNSLKESSIRVPDENYPVFSINLSKSKSLIGVAEGELYLLEHKSFSLVELDDSDFLKGHNLLGGQLLQDSLLALSTLSGGVLLVNWQTGKTIGKVDYDTGLPDNEIFAIFKDQKGRVWIAHEYGISVLDFTSPIEVYSGFYGLKGSILSVGESKDMLYVGTSVGLFYFDQEDDITEIKRIVQLKEQESRPILLNNKAKKVAKKIPTKKNKGTADKLTETESEEKKKSPWLKRLFSKRKGKKNRKKNRKNNEDNTIEKEFPTKEDEETLLPEKEKASPIAEETETFTIINADKPKSKSRYKVESIQVKTESYYVFRQLAGIDGKCQQLIFTPMGLLAVTNSGLFLIEGTKVKAITKEATRLAYYSKRFHRIYVSTYTDKLLVFKENKRKWEPEPIFESFNKYVSAFLEDENGDLWVCSNTSLFKMRLDEDGFFQGMIEHEITNPYNDDVRAVMWDDKLYFLLSSAAYYLDGAGELTKDTVLVRHKDQAQILSHSHQVSWLHNGTDWLMLSGKNASHISTSLKLNYLKWLGKLSGIFIGHGSILWAVTEQNELFKIDLKDGRSVQDGYAVYLESIQNHNNHYLDLDNFQIDRKDNQGLYFSFSIPSYFEEGNSRYQYRLLGRDKGWTDWTSKSMISYVGLPSGDYKLGVRGKDAFGNITELEPISFKIVPPYWEQPWFYGAEILFFSTLLVLSYRLNTKKFQYKVLSQVLTIFTLILIVEFIQVTIEGKVNIEKTPVTNFAIQAGIALLVFPLERLLSYVIRREYVRQRKNAVLEKEEIKEANTNDHVSE